MRGLPSGDYLLSLFLNKTPGVSGMSIQTFVIILWNSIAVTSNVFTELAYTMKYGGGGLI